jgi:hypothetical protein
MFLSILFSTTLSLYYSHSMWDQSFTIMENRHNYSCVCLDLYIFGKGRSFPEVERPGPTVNYPSPSTAEVKERADLYFYFPSVPSCQVIEWPLPFLPFIFLERNLEDKILNRILRAEKFWDIRPQPITFTCHLYLYYCLIWYADLYSANSFVL